MTLVMSRADFKIDLNTKRHGKLFKARVITRDVTLIALCSLTNGIIDNDINLLDYLENLNFLTKLF